ncbi:hypothetical protein JB92DRAFT_3033542 [Gautieria morchelliformis]|nr:hypothetical protein JB92DRAFT_3033542 [Gautieria morchelliformis]
MMECGCWSSPPHPHARGIPGFPGGHVTPDHVISGAPLRSPPRVDHVAPRHPHLTAGSPAWPAANLWVLSPKTTARLITAPTESCLAQVLSGLHPINQHRERKGGLGAKTCGAERASELGFTFARCGAQRASADRSGREATKGVRESSGSVPPTSGQVLQSKRTWLLM